MGRGKHSFLNDGDEHVGVDIPANPLSFVGARQHAQDFPGLPASLLASTSPQSRCPPLGHANMFRIFPTCWRLCWRRPPRKPFVFRWGTPTRFRLFRSAGVIVGVDLPANPLSSVGARQHAQDFPGLPGLLLASTSPQSLYPTSDHANTIRIISICRCSRMKEPASGKQSQLDDEKEHVRLNQPGWHERRIRDVSPGDSLITCSSRLIVKLLLTGAGLNPEKK